ncbi:hypothetical protein AB433_13355 [Croceicoccus naphthovorans]|uniref:Pyrrolo-quinoline quinone repeat domain-containing protein n=1 Tax=Croceicoccus naphthovorans TaxID=1348774 RepID=A0A0G3XMU6_9SPHN|nr:hypothetical protein AB433_13355 [Croceicoccus naphthovorans]
MHRFPSLLAALALTIISLTLIVFGAQLAWLKGSPYYLLSGLSLAVCAWLFGKRDRRGYWLYLFTVLATIVWAFWEIGADKWGLMARLLAPLVLLVILTLLAIWLPPASSERGRIAKWHLVSFAVIQVAALAASWWALSDRFSPSGPATTSVASADVRDWPSYGGDWQSDRYSPLDQITPDNAGLVETAWSVRLGGLDDLGNNSRFTATPIAIDDTLYLCDPLNRLIALDATTGSEKWRHDPKVDSTKAFSIVCRGVSYHQSERAGECAARILEGTLDARLIAVDAATGRPCSRFGTSGAVNLVEGVAREFDGYYYVTSPPAIIDDIAVVGGYVIDNQRLDPARSVIRGYDAVTGELRWTWDAGRADSSLHGQLFSSGNPNAWAVFSADPERDLVFIPTGNSSPDFFGGLRSQAADRYGTSIVALESHSGKVVWSFQAVHHDLWDYDMPAQPALIDFPVDGKMVPAVAAATKTGQIFVLDRQTGKPLAPVEERPVPASGIAGERASPTQPYSVGMPSFHAKPVNEKSLWGATPIDQMLCRLRFRQLKYDGDFTPPSTDPFLMSPGTFGAINWGGVSVDRSRGLMIVNNSDMPFVGQLVPRDRADALGARPFDARTMSRSQTVGKTMPPPMAMAGTPFGLYLKPFLSPIYFPCTAPPWGRISAIDLATRELAWTRPFGTSRGLDPFGIDLPMGLFNLGGSVSTAGGVTFIGAATDGYMRAFDTATGQELWRADLPAGGQASPVTYAGRDGRQMVAIVAGGHGSLRTKRGDHVVAFALPKATIRENGR